MSILLADLDATCAALGYSDGAKYHAEPDAMQGLKHLIWILRRDLDNHEYRRHLGRSKVLQTDLVCMLPDYIDNEEFADVLIRLLVILTNPTLLLYRDGAPKDGQGRKIFMELIDILQCYKSAFTVEKLWSALAAKLKKSLEIDWAVRSEEQGLLIERILVLIRNVLQVPANPEAECRADNDASLHDQVIWALHQSGILDLVLFVVSSSDENQYHLHGLEILCLLYREQTAASLADASLQRSASEKHRDEQELIAARRREKQKLIARPPPGRHSRFGGTYVIQNFKSVSDRDTICHQSLERAVAIDFDREKEKQKKSHRLVKEENPAVRRSAFSVRLCLREYCIEVLRSAYNTLVRQVRRVLERNSGSTSHDDSYLLWAMRFFMEFNRLTGLQLHLVSESLSVQCFHWVLTRMQHDMDMITSDKKQARLWAKRLHVGIQTFRELLLSLLALQKLQDEKARALFDMLLNNVCYVMEYRETILHLLMNYNESHSTKAYLRDVVETANIFIKMMEKFCKDSVVVQDKRRTKKKSSGKKSKKAAAEKITQENEEELENKWAEMASHISSILSNELNLPEEDQPIPFDAASDTNIDDQKEDCMLRIHKLLRQEQLEKAISLMRAAREVWPENDCFGALMAAPEDELLLLREIFLHNLGPVENSNDNCTAEDGNEDGEHETDADDEEEEDDNYGMVEKTFRFDDFAKRLLNPKIVRACTIVVADWEQIPTKSLKCAVTILHRIAYGCSCPAMLFQAMLFKIFQQVFDAPRNAHQEELRRLGIYVVRKFVETAPKNPKIYAELLFYKSIKDANELETGYCDAYDAGTKVAWTEEQETELRFLFDENQRNPATDKDVIDWILDNLLDKTRTRRAVLKKLKEMSLLFKAPTKKSSAAAAASKNLWRTEEDEELKSLYDEHRLEDDCLQMILNEFGERRNQNQIVKRLLQLHIIADKSEILPAKQRKRKPKRTTNDEEQHGFEMEEEGGGINKSKSKARKSKKNQTTKPRKVSRTPLDIGTVRSLVAQIDIEKFQDAIGWLKESLDDAAADAEDPSEEDDGIPLLPLQEIEKEAMEDNQFQKVLLALGIQPPIAEMENYWRIPVYLNAADLHLRAKIVAGEEVPEENEKNSGDDECENDESGRDSNNSSEESEIDYLETYIEKRRQKLNDLMFSKSDNEDESREPLFSKSTEKTHYADGNEDLANDTEKKREEKRTAKKSTRKINQVNDDNDNDDELNFNSEDFRQRLVELGDGTADEEDDSDNNDTTVIEATNSVTPSGKLSRSRRTNVIDSDSDSGDGDAKAKSSNQPEGNAEDTTTAAALTETTKSQSNAVNVVNKKRLRSDDESAGADEVDNDDDDDEDLVFIKRKKPTAAEQTMIASGEEPPKRRRIAVIDDDDEDDF